MKPLAFITVLILGGFLTYATGDFPPIGDPYSPANTNVSPHYLEHSLDETAVPNVVTAVLADYRGFDTMFETTVIFAGGLACLVLLRRRRHHDPREVRMYRHLPTDVVIHMKPGRRLKDDARFFEPIDSDWTPYDIITRTTVRVLVPFIQLFALYVVAHGHHSPGGGFQGGVILGATLVLLAMGFDLRSASRRLPERLNGLLSAWGVLVYVGVGALCLILGGNFLDYGYLAGVLVTDPIHARSLGILLVETGVAVAVMATMFLIYRVVASGGDLEEGL